MASRACRWRADAIVSAPSDRDASRGQIGSVLGRAVNELVERLVERRRGGEAAHLLQHHIRRKAPGPRGELREEQRSPDRVSREEGHHGLEQTNQGDRRADRPGRTGGHLVARSLGAKGDCRARHAASRRASSSTRRAPIELPTRSPSSRSCSERNAVTASARAAIEGLTGRGDSGRSRGGERDHRSAVSVRGSETRCASYCSSFVRWRSRVSQRSSNTCSTRSSNSAAYVCASA